MLFPFTCVKQERLHRVNRVPLVTCWRSESFAAVQEGGAPLGLTVKTLYLTLSFSMLIPKYMLIHVGIKLKAFMLMSWFFLMKDVHLTSRDN